MVELTPRQRLTRSDKAKGGSGGVGQDRAHIAMAAEIELSEPARLLLLASLLAKDGLISHNGEDCCL